MGSLFMTGHQQRGLRLFDRHEAVLSGFSVSKRPPYKRSARTGWWKGHGR